MSKITFRADDDLVHRLEEFDASKSEVMREALREYLGESRSDGRAASERTDGGAIDEVIAERIDQLVAERIDGRLAPRDPQDVNVTITLEGEAVGASAGTPSRKTTDREAASAEAASAEPASEAERQSCNRCGEELPESAVYCANCGEKAAHRVFCECGDELRSDWSFCPGCGRRTTAAEVLGDT